MRAGMRVWAGAHTCTGVHVCLVCVCVHTRVCTHMARQKALYGLCVHTAYYVSV